MILLSLDTLQNILAMILVLGGLVFFHELGHFILARRAGILCREFALGMGPKLFSFKKGETRYTLRLLPIGGFVRMAGEDPEVVEVKTGQKVGLQFDEENRIEKIILNHKKEYSNIEIVTVKQVDLEEELVLFGEDESENREQYRVHPQAMIVHDRKETQIAPRNRQFAGKRLWPRIATVIAGPAANFILAAVFLVSLGLSIGIPMIDAQLGKVLPNSPAAVAGLQQGDDVLSINGTEVNSFAQMAQMVSQSPGEPIGMVIERHGKQYSVNVTPENEDGRGMIGVHRAMDRLGLQTTYDYTALIIKTLGMLVTGQVSFQDLSGPVGIYHMTGEVADQGIINLIQWSAILSINLGIMNLLPIPALDGGRLLFLLLEGVRGRPVDPHKEGMVHFLGFAFLILLMVAITWNDINRFF